MASTTSTGISSAPDFDAATAENPIILFDGVCNYCNSILNYIIKHDHKKRFRFAHLQSNAGQDLLEKYGFPRDMLDSVVLIENGKAHIKTDVTIRIAPHMGGIARVAVLLRFVPRFIRDFGYDVIAHNRYKWWGKQNACIVPTPDVRDRFLA
ncbi:MAG: thiol-disulfide oxidoreductase DCC family protein [Candidatus Hydrogenedentes bacterium]|nr:thiol-disulfide oxidoreductase DCC family protein [Candidatus Hydrogenedentota bacterium]